MNKENYMTEMPHQDGEERHYHVRKLDNRVRVTMSRHCGMPPNAPRNWHVSLEVLDGLWVHVPGSAEGLFSEMVAKDRVRELYQQLSNGKIRATKEGRW